MHAWQATILASVVGLVGLATGNRIAEIAASALVGILLLGTIYRIFSVGDVRGKREIDDSTVAWGDVLAQRVTLTNNSWLGIPAIRVTDLSTLPEHPGGYVTNLRARGSIVWEVEIPCRTRGRFRVGPVEAYISDPIGLFPVQREVGKTSSVLVLPRWVPLTHSALKLDGFMPGEARGRVSGESHPTVSSVREYTPGDSVSAIHWQASARSNQLMTKLFDPEVQTTVWLALDLDGELNADAEELLVTATASLAMFALHQANLRVGLVASGNLPVLLPAERGKPYQYRMQEVLAEVHQGKAGTLADLLTKLDRRLGPGQAIVLLTTRGPDVWGAWLGRMARQGVAARIIEVAAGPDRARDAGDHAWPVPGVRLPIGLAKPELDGALVAYLEGRTRELSA
jgi:uncharacterized protein (DUF58 family)